MAIGSILLWLGIPVGWLYLVSRLVKSSQPSMGPYVLLIVGIPASMIVVGKALSKLNRVYGEVTGTTPTMRVRSPWMKSMRGERDSGAPAHRPRRRDGLERRAGAAVLRRLVLRVRRLEPAELTQARA